MTEPTGSLSWSALVGVDFHPGRLEREVAAQREVGRRVLRIAAPALEVFAILERAMRTCEPRMPTRRSTQSLCGVPSVHAGHFANTVPLKWIDNELQKWLRRVFLEFREMELRVLLSDVQNSLQLSR